jgi:hypothetical protein
VQLAEIRRLLWSEMAQEDQHFLNYCVNRADLLSDLRNQDNRFCIINAARGAGKSGLLIAHERNLTTATAHNNRAIKKYYADEQLPDGEVSINQYINFWKNTILGWIVAVIGSEIAMAISDDDICRFQYSLAKISAIYGQSAA